MISATLENLFNYNLSASPRARKICAELKGKRLQISVDGLDFQIVIESLGHSIALGFTPNGACEVEISGSIVNLMALTGKNPAILLQTGAVKVRGDANILQEFRELIMLLRPDLEEELGKLIGDAAAHQLGRITKSLLVFRRRASLTTVQNLAEYFSHESGDLVPGAEAEVFFENVDALREACDRCEARLNSILSSLEHNALEISP